MRKRVLWKKEHEDTPCKDKFFIWSCFVRGGVEANDIIRYANYKQSKELPIVYKKVSSVFLFINKYYCGLPNLLTRYRIFEQFDPIRIHEVAICGVENPPPTVEHPNFKTQRECVA
jgi:hypothetical protein